MKNIFKRGLSLVLSLSLAFSLMAVGASAEEFADMPNGWSRNAVASAVENGLLRGNDGKLDPTGLLTRAQLATVIVRAFGATAEADLSGFTDVKADGWYYSALAKAKGMGVMNGTSSTTMSPDRPISRQEVFVILARALKLADGKAETLNAYKDAESVGAWAVGGTAAMVSAGYVSGSNGYLLPTDNITREQFAQIIYNIFGTYYQAAGVYTDDVENSLLVNVPDVIIKNAKIAGDLVVGDGVGEGDLTLENVSIGGRLVVRGGGVNSIHIKGSTVSSVVVAKENGAVRVVADNSSKVEYINIADGKDDVIIEGKVDTVIVENEAVPVILKDATVDTVQVNGDKAEISLVGSTEVSTLNVAEDAEGVKLNKEKSTTVGTLNTESDITVTGEGKISNITGSGKPTNETGDEVKPTTTPTGSGSSGGGGGHSHSYAAEWTTDETHHWHAATCSHTDQKSGYAEHTYTITSDTATCTAAGEKTETCVCGVSRTTASPAKGHTEETIPAVPATCAAAGKTAGKKCSVCGEVLDAQQDIPATGEHTWGGWSKVDDTNHKRTCSVCQGEETAEHTWNGGEITTEPTETNDGVKTYTCTACGEKKTEVVSKTGPSEPQQVSAIKGLSFDSKNGQLKLTIEKPDDETGIKRYEVFLSKDSGATWPCYASIIHTDESSTELLGNGGLGSELEDGVYNKIKVVSKTEKKSNYTANELVVDCSITVNVSKDSNATATFTSTDSGEYTVDITGLSYEEGKEKWYELAFVNSVESPTSAGSSCTYMSSATATKTVDSNEYSGYYKIREYSDLTVDGMNATVNVKETEWQRCSLET